MVNKKELAAKLRKTAQHYREHAAELDEKKAIKCAQVLTAAKGLSQLQHILRGAGR